MQIIDAHQHFWDLDRNYLPWLKDEPPIKFRYGDYSALKRNYLPADYRADSGGSRSPAPSSSRPSGTRRTRWARCAGSRRCNGARACRA